MQRRQGRQRRQDLAQTAHPHRLAFKADRHIGTKAFGVIGPGVQRAQHRSRIGRAATDARGDRQVLFQRDCHLAPGQPGGAQAQIVRPVVQSGGERSGYGQRQRPRRDRHPVADVQKHHQRIQQVIAIGTAAGDMQRQVQLGRSLLAADHGCPVAGSLPPLAFSSASTASRPLSSLARMRLVVASVSGFRDRARCHWISASRWRPTIQ